MQRPLALYCRSLRKSYGEVEAVRDVSLSISRGECLGLLGPNGAGKSTTMELLAGLQQPDAGEIHLLGRRLQAHDRQLRSQIGVQLQSCQLPAQLSVLECIRLFRSCHRRGRSPDELLDMVTLREKMRARVSTLSGGQLQRLALACALAGDPELLFLDEPTTGLDPQARLNIWQVIEAFCARGGAVLLSTHYMDEAARLCERVAIIDGGRVVALDSPELLIERLGASQVVRLEFAHELADASFLAELPHLANLIARGSEVTMTTPSVSDLLPLALRACERHGRALLRVTTHAATLEDVFVALTGRALRDA